jgi:hypothetical protein
MNASSEATHGWRQVLDYTPFPYLRKGLSESWQSPPRSGAHRLIAPWAYRHLRFYGIGHITGGSIAAAAGLICLAYSAHGWAGFFLAIAALNLAGGFWYLTIDRSSAARS